MDITTLFESTNKAAQSNYNDTPFMRQYKALKQEAPQGSVLLVRLGDFYEAFGEDAEILAPRFKTALTRRGGMPMTGCFRHVIDMMIRSPLCGGLIFAIAEEAEDPRTAKGVIRREIVRIVNGGEVEA